MAQPKTPAKRSIVITARLVPSFPWPAPKGCCGFWDIHNGGAWTRPGARFARVSMLSDLGWSVREGTFDVVWAGERSARYTNWSGGLRATAAEEPAGDAKNRPQVLFFGDSFPQGYQLSDEETLPGIVQRRHPEASVSNFGAENYGTYQSYLAMKKWVHGPSSVSYLFNAFHCGGTRPTRAGLRIFKKPPPGCFYPFAVLSGGELEARRSQGDLVWPLSRRLRTVAMVQEYKQMFESYFRVHNRRCLTETLLVKMNELSSRGRREVHGDPVRHVA